MSVPVRFSFEEFRKELNSLKKIAENFLERDAGQVVDRSLEQLNQIQTQPAGRQHRFIVDQNWPIRSRKGRSFEGKNRKTAFEVYGEATWVWEITALDNRRKKSTEFEVTGIASTKLKVFRVDGKENKEIAMWRVELGDISSPGTYFHNQILGELDVLPFPHSLPVPRLPSIFVTPMSAVEFLLSELYQEKWVEHATGDGDDLKYWNQIQRKRLRRMLEWKLSQIENNQGSPWVALKLAKPQAKESLFL